MPPVDPIITQMQKQIKDLQGQMRKAMATTSALQGQPADATLSIPHNDSLWFGDNVDGTHPGNFRYVIADNVQRIVSARLSIHLAPYRTYNTSSGANTGIESANHSHGHGHSWHVANEGSATGNMDVGGTTVFSLVGPTDIPTTTNSAGQSADHTHPLNIAQTLGVTEGATATGVTIAFDGVDATAALGGPFNADVIELDVRRFLVTKIGVYHTIALQPTGNGRIEAHLRLGYYASAGSVF